MEIPACENVARTLQSSAEHSKSVCGEGSIIRAIHEELDVPPLEDEILAKEEWGVARDGEVFWSPLLEQLFSTGLGGRLCSL